MPNIRLTSFFKDDDGHGWSETHDKDGGAGSPSLSSFLSAFNNMMIDFRRPLLAGDAFYIGCRASYKLPNGTTAGDNIELNPPMVGAKTYAGEDLQMTAPEASVKLRFRNDSSTQRSDVYLRGMWSQTVLAGILSFGSAAGAEWKRRCDLYAGELISKGYGWVGTNANTTSRGKVTGYIQNPDLTVTFTVLPTNGIVLPAAGTKVNVKFARLNGSKSILNRVLVCTVLTGGLTLQSEEKVTPSDFQTSGTYIATQTALVPYAAVSYYKLARRATGRPFGVGRGRSAVQTLH